MVGFRWSALLAVLVLAGCGGMGTRVASEALAPDDHEAAGQHFGYITAVDRKARTITFDPAEWLDGEDGRRRAVEAGIIGPNEPLSNDHAILNPSRRTTVLKVAPNAIITAAGPVSALEIPPPASCQRTICPSYPVPQEAFFASFGKPDACKCMYRFWLTIRGDTARRLDEQYTP